MVCKVSLLAVLTMAMTLAHIGVSESIGSHSVVRHPLRKCRFGCPSRGPSDIACAGGALVDATLLAPSCEHPKGSHKARKAVWGANMP